LRQFPEIPQTWGNGELGAKWDKVRRIRRVVTGALEVERREKRIGSSLEAAPDVYVEDADLRAAYDGLDLAEIAITSGGRLLPGPIPGDAFKIDDITGVGVVPVMAEGRKCERSWRILSDIGTETDFPGLSPRDAEAVRQFDARKLAAQ
jgi:isoleucyl-tRNA synthetase